VHAPPELRAGKTTPGGQPLAQFLTPRHGFNCDACGAVLPEGASAHGNRAEDYDVCGACFGAAAADAKAVVLAAVVRQRGEVTCMPPRVIMSCVILRTEQAARRGGDRRARGQERQGGLLCQADLVPPALAADAEVLWAAARTEPAAGLDEGFLSLCPSILVYMGNPY
jgi:hypothetical protein